MRVSPEIKAGAESVFSSLGMTLAEAINIFLHKSIMEGGLPFDVRQSRYNAETEAAMDEAHAIIDGSVPAEPYDSPAAMLAALDEEARTKGHIGPIGSSAI